MFMLYLSCSSSISLSEYATCVGENPFKILDPSVYIDNTPSKNSRLVN